MKILFFILFSLILLFSINEKSNEEILIYSKHSKEAITAQEVPFVFSINPTPINYDKIEFWQDDEFEPKIK